MEPVACFVCGTPVSMKYGLYRAMYGDEPNKTQKLYNDTLQTLNIRNMCCRAQFLCTMTRPDMIKRSTEVRLDESVLNIIKEYEHLTRDPLKNKPH